MASRTRSRSRFGETPTPPRRTSTFAPQPIYRRDLGADAARSLHGQAHSRWQVVHAAARGSARPQRHRDGHRHSRRSRSIGAISVLMPPGRYTVKLTVDGKSYTQPLEVRRDPNATATDIDIRAAADLSARSRC